jgi:FkbM family methyltransferase
LKKAITYTRYLWDFLKYGDFKSIAASVKYVLSGRSHPNDRLITTSIGRFMCRKNTNDFQFANLYYEWGVKRFLLNYMKEFSIFIDVGACIGDYSILLAKMGKHCHAFEMVPENLEALRRNLELNGLQDKVKVYPYGLGDADYPVAYTFDPVNTGASRINRTPGPGTPTVEIRRLDSFIDTLMISKDEPVLVKLDVEGMEAEVISGAREFIRLHDKITFIVEDKHCEECSIADAFREAGSFEFGRVDSMNLFAKKMKKL